MPEMENVNVYSDHVATIADVMQLISRLPYRDACEFAEAVSGDVDKIVEGAANWLDVAAEETRPQQ